MTEELPCHRLTNQDTHMTSHQDKSLQLVQLQIFFYNTLKRLLPEKQQSIVTETSN
uniref:Phenylalanyl-tRNA synthetase beta chain family protein n=1 Tax=Rhizophora mucronata TaxID=61149 RepID=A0A2P2MTM3_RHIMU